MPMDAQESEMRCEVETSTGPCASTTKVQQSPRGPECFTHRRQISRSGAHSQCIICGLPIASGKQQKRACLPCIEGGCMAETTEGSCGASLFGGGKFRGSVHEGKPLCRSHAYNKRYCGGCSGLLPRGPIGQSPLGIQWCSDECQIAIRYKQMTAQASLEQRGYKDACLVFGGSLNDSGYARVYGRLAGQQVWLGHRIGWIKSQVDRGRSVREIVESGDLGQHFDHLCQTKACVRGSHLQIISPGAHSEITWDRHTQPERAQRLLRIALGAIAKGGGLRSDLTVEWAGLVVTVTPVVQSKEAA